MNIGFDAKRAFHNFTGLGNYSRFIIEALQENYPDNQYYLYTPKVKSKGETKQIECLNIVTAPGKYSKIKSLWRSLFLFGTVREAKLNIFHGLSNELPAFGGKGIKKIVTIHDLIFLRFPELYPFIDRQLYKWKFKKACKKADIVVAISEQTKSDIIDFFGVKPEKIRVIYQGHHNVFNSKYTDSELEKIKKKYQLPKKYILNVGTLEERKNVLHLLKAYKKLKNPLPIVLVGKSTNYTEKIRDYAIEHNIEVHFLDNVDFVELPAIYQLSKLFVYPSIFEGFGIPIIEAQISKVPVITSSGSCFKEAGGEGATYVSSSDVSELAGKIDQLLSDEKLQNECVAKGLENLKRFTKQKIADDIMDVYRSA